MRRARREKEKKKEKQRSRIVRRSTLVRYRVRGTADSCTFDRRRAKIYSGEYFGGGKEKYETLERKTVKKHVRSDRVKIARFDSCSINRCAFR